MDPLPIRSPRFSPSRARPFAQRPDCFPSSPSVILFSFGPPGPHGPGSGPCQQEERPLRTKSIRAKKMRTKTIRAKNTCRLALEELESRLVLTLPRPDHVVLAMMENHNYGEIIGVSSAPYINNTLAAQGALMTNSFAIEHPSEPNYLDIFSGSNQGITKDGVDNPGSLSAPNLGQGVLAKGLTWGAYIEDLTDGHNYDHDHAPWDLFNNDGSPGAEHDFTAWPTDFTQLPKVSIVTPNLQDDMHDGTILQGDTW